MFDGRTILKSIVVMSFGIVWLIPGIVFLANPSASTGGFLAVFSLVLYLIYKGTIIGGRKMLDSMELLERPQ